MNMLQGKELLQSSQKWATIIHIALIHLQRLKVGHLHRKFSTADYMVELTDMKIALTKHCSVQRCVELT